MSLKQWWANKRIASLVGIVSGTIPCGDGKERVKAAEELGQIGPEAAYARPFLVKALDDHKCRGLALAAAVAFTRIGADETAAPACTSWLSQSRASVDSLAFATLLCSLGPKAQQANRCVVTAISGTVRAWQREKRLRDSPILRDMSIARSALCQEADRENYERLPLYIGVLLKCLCMLDISDVPQDVTADLEERLASFVTSEDSSILRRWALLALLVHFPKRTISLQLDPGLRALFQGIMESTVVSATMQPVERAACRVLLDSSAPPTETMQTVINAIRRSFLDAASIEALRFSATDEDLRSFTGS